MNNRKTSVRGGGEGRERDSRGSILSLFAPFSPWLMLLCEERRVDYETSAAVFPHLEAKAVVWAAETAGQLIAEPQRQLIAHLPSSTFEGAENGRSRARFITRMLRRNTWRLEESARRPGTGPSEVEKNKNKIVEAESSTTTVWRHCWS